ncbi:TRAP transporter substrate-binding protein [Blastochloris sulfoviridis]|uniref:TRAP transporter substrate-binding protein n=1 Tax=Blastochloris sulfoviridis TaxID=50712 RepID=A0A5M6HVK3_9HYPH|nr:TRAP transporter substrate-binding protein [Blastochloris sulfoviridis]KAA5599589.1 TRAP transporter substrate-binding protein [Blastochloris sulfoviridis]
MPSRRRIIGLAGRGLAGALLASPAVLRARLARAAEVTLRLHHFLPPTTSGQVGFLAPWAKKIEAESEGRIRIDIFPSMQLGGKPPQLYDQARDGVADLVWTLPGYTAGRFPILETFELPFIADKRARVNALAVQDFADAHLGAELGEVKPLCVWAHDGGVIHSSRQVAKLEDMKGLKLRFPSRLSGEALKALGAQAIGMPVPQVPEALSQRVIDGAVVPWEVVPAVKLQELVKFHTEFAGSPTFYVATFVLAMNRARYDGLPAELKAVIDANSGLAAAAMAGRSWDAASAEVRERVGTRGNTITTLPPEEVARWRAATEPVVSAWLAQMAARGLDGQRYLAAARAAIAKYAAA